MADKQKMCMYITCMGALIAVVLSVLILVKLKKSEKFTQNSQRSGWWGNKVGIPLKKSERYPNRTPSHLRLSGSDRHLDPPSPFDPWPSKSLVRMGVSGSGDAGITAMINRACEVAYTTQSNPKAADAVCAYFEDQVPKGNAQAAIQAALMSLGDKSDLGSSVGASIAGGMIKTMLPVKK